MRISDWSSDVCSSDLILSGVALHARRFEIILLELLFGDVAVIALQLLLGAELDAEIRHLALAALTVLAGAIFAAVDRALRAAPDVFTHPAVEFILGALALRRSEEHTSELQSLMRISYAVFCLQKQIKNHTSQR